MGFILLALCPRPGAAEPAAPELPYRMRIAGVADSELRREMEDVSDLVALRRRPPFSEPQLRRRAERDADLFLRLLRSRGYYAAAVEIAIHTHRRPARVIMSVKPGPQYTFRHLRIAGLDPEFMDLSVIESGLRGLVPALGDPAAARAVVRADERLVQHLDSQGFPFARIERREVRVSHEDQAMDVVWHLHVGPRAVFGPATVVGLNRVREAFVRRQFPWREGDDFDGSQLRLAQRRLSRSGLFSIVQVATAEELDEDGALATELRLLEHKSRSVTLGAGYRSSEGFHASAGWLHRNLAGAGERLELQGVISEIGYNGELRFRRPDFRRLDQHLSLSLRAALDDPEAYHSRRVGALAGIERVLTPRWVANAGAGFSAVSVRQEDESQRFGLIYLPMGIKMDGSDDVLNPTRGGRFSLGAAPYHDVLESGITFVNLRAAATRYVALDRGRRWIVAGRAVAAGLWGAERDEIPADERLYAGGGGTLRGYGYQSVGPLKDKTPIGGRSMALLSLELRRRWSRDFGMVGFIDGGLVREDARVTDLDGLTWGAGLGLRYFTPVGPLRLDVAFPLNRRADLDDPWQLYVSLGQAF